MEALFTQAMRQGKALPTEPTPTQADTESTIIVGWWVEPKANPSDNINESDYRVAQV
jgi:hypothetical protein